MMPAATVHATTVADVVTANTFPALAAEYEAEAKIAGLPAPTTKFDQYRELERLGMLHAFGAALDDQLVGFVAVLAPVMPHYAATIAVAESFFVGKAYRGSGAGLKLLRIAEDKARALGSPVLLVSTPYGGDLFKVLPRRSYTEVSRVFCRRLLDA